MTIDKRRRAPGTLPAFTPICCHYHRHDAWHRAMEEDAAAGRFGWDEEVAGEGAAAPHAQPRPCHPEDARRD